MRTICILDTETTGLDPAKNACIEVACVLYNVDHAAPVASYASLMYATDNAAEDVNRIPANLLQSGDCPVADKVWQMVRAMVARCDAVVAHRAEFDRSFVPASVRDMKPWICSKFDIEWPRSKLGAGLVDTALAHGLGVVHAHRAMSDCDTLVRLFQRVAELGHDVHAMLSKAARPRRKYVSLAPFAEKDVVKAYGFAFDPSRREWWRNMPPEDVASLPFRVQEVV